MLFRSSANTTFGDTDFGWFGILIGYSARTGVLPGIVLLVVVGALILGGAILMQRRVVDGGWDPSPARVPVGAAAGTGENGRVDESSGAAADGRTAARSGTTHPRVAPPVVAPTPPPPPAD